MTNEAENSAPMEEAEVLRNVVEVTVQGEDVDIPLEDVGLTMDSTSREVLDAVRGIVRETHGVDINDEYGDVSYTVRKATNTGVIHVYPKPVAG